MNDRQITTFAELRKVYDLTQRALAEILGVSQPYIAAVESGTKGVSPERVADAVARVEKLIPQRERDMRAMREIINRVMPFTDVDRLRLEYQRAERERKYGRAS